MKGPIVSVQYFYVGDVATGLSYQAKYVSTTENKRKPLPYKKEEVTLLQTNDKGPSDYQDWYQAYGYLNQNWGQLSALAGNRARARFIDSVRAEAMLVVNTIEARKTLETVSKLLRTIRSPLKSLLTYMKSRVRRHRNESSAAYFERLLKTPLRDISGAYLQFHFGIEPLYKDIYAVLDAFDNVANYSNPKLVRARGSAQKAEAVVVAGSPRRDCDVSMHVSLHVGAKVQVSNPNRYLLQQLGFANPAAIIWELVPFSFLIDWFTPIGSWLESSTDLAGLTLSDGYVSIKSSSTSNDYEGEGYNPGNPSKPRNRYRAFRFERTVTDSHIGVQLVTQVPKLTTTKGLVSASLLALFGLRGDAGKARF